MKTIAKPFLALVLAITLVITPLLAYAETEPAQEPAGKQDGEIHATPGVTGDEDPEPVESDEDPEPAAPETVQAEITVGTFGLETFAATDGTAVAKFVADNHVLMLRADGRLLVWGDNTYGQLGLGSGSPNTVYTPTENTFFSGKKIKDIAVCEDASFVLLGNGELYSFGKGLNGRLGNGSTANISTPTLISGSESLRLDKLYPGNEFILAASDDNKLYAWGRNNRGQIGNGTMSDVTSPFMVMDTANIKTLEVGDDYVLLIKQDNYLWGWGNNNKGQFPYVSQYKTGIVSTEHILSGSASSTTYTGAAITSPPSAGSTRVYDITETLTECVYPSRIGVDVRTIKGNLNLYTYQRVTDPIQGGQVGYSGEYTYSTQDAPLTDNSYISNLCVYKSFSATWSRYSPNGVITAKTTWTENPIINMSMPADVTKITNLQLGSKHGYLTYNNKVYSWGDNSLKQQSSDYITSGMLSPAATINSFITNLDSTGGGFNELTVARDTNYILTSSGNVYVWGDNAYGKAGTGSAAATIDAPTAMTDLNGKAIAKIVPGRNTTFYISHTGDVYVTGDNFYGQSGLGDSYSGDSKITSPEKIETFKFSDTATPPDAPDTINTPDEVEAGTVIEIHWPEVANATEYELVRYATPKSDVMTFALPSAELVYSGDQSTCSDIALDSWENVSYGLRAVNFIGDKSGEVTSNSVNVLSTAGSGGNNNGTGDNNSNNNNNGNNSGGMSDEQLALILAALKNNGASEDLIAAILAANKKSGNVNVTTPAADNKELLALIATLATNNGSSTGQALPSDTHIYNQGADGKVLEALVEYMISSGPNGEPAPAAVDTLDAALKVATLKALDTLGTQLAKSEPMYYQPQQTGGLTAKTVSLYIIIIMILAAGALVVINIIPLADEEEEYDAD